MHGVKLLNCWCSFARDMTPRRSDEKLRLVKTLRQWLNLYLTIRKDLRARTVETYTHSADRHLAAWINRPLRSITADMVEQRYAEIGEASGHAAANAAMRAFRMLWNFALDRDETLSANPVRRLKKAWFPLPPRERIVRSDELSAFYQAVDQLANRTASDYVKTLLFTGLRRREAAGLRWSDIDFATKVIRLPATKTKAG